MQISPIQYLSLTDQLNLLSQKVKIYQIQNKKLSQQLTKHTQTINFLTQQLTQQKDKNISMQQQIINHIDNNSNNIENAVRQATEQQMRYFQIQMEKIKNDANVQKIKQLEKKMAENRFNNHEMVDFYQKIQSLYMVLTNKKTVPSMPQLYKWATLRKAEQVYTNQQNPSVNNSYLNKSKISISKTNISQINKSHTNIPKMNASNTNIPKINVSKITKKSNSPLNNIKNMTASKSIPNMSLLKPPKGKQNNDRNIKSNKNIAKDKNKNNDKIQICETQSFTQQMNVQNYSSVSPTDKLIDD